MFAWEIDARGANVPQVLLSAPSLIWGRLISSILMLAADFVQTFKAVLAGFTNGCGPAFVGGIPRRPLTVPAISGLLPIRQFRLGAAHHRHRADWW